MNDRFIEDLKNRTDIVELVRKYTELKKSGKNYMCRSPFRNERTPSFCVSPERQFWYDFGSSEGGDAISFLEKMESLSFPEAVEMLADAAGIDVPKDFGGDKGPSREEKKDIFALHRKAGEYFQAQLSKDKKSKEYLSNRKISEKTIADWWLGYGGLVKDGLTKHLLDSGFSQDMIAQSGVAFERDFGNKKMQDRFYGRLMIPIFEPKNGEIIAFTGRDLSGDKKSAKYINSPENPVYHKSATLFGLHRARKIIREKDAVILVEGNFDVISAHAAGFKNCVATCGTSLTEDHLRLLKRLSKNIYLAFDSDIAGKKATLRGAEMILKMELNPFIIEITGKKDLDEVAQKDPDALKDLIEGAQNAVLFLLEKFADKNLNGSIEGEKKFLDSIFHFLKLIHRPIERDEILSRVAQKTKRAKGIIEEEFIKFEKQSRRTQKKEKEEESSVKKFTREECFVGFVGVHWASCEELLNENHLGLLAGAPREILEKKLTQTSLSKEEQEQLSGWELHEENLYGEHVSEEVVKRDFSVFANELQKVKAKEKRTEEAKKIRETLSA
jgi:DNA primase